ncbi:MAG: ThuA domain-containing protein [Bryobacteraceae bacterium]|nr:ThuA domain-containing protein [Bryobacteraceae bacterium]
MGFRLVALGLLLACAAWPQPKRVLYVTHSAGFRHDSIGTSIDVLRSLSPDEIDVSATEDLSVITAGGLRDYDAVFFFTSGELPLSDAQKAALLEFVRSGKGFGGAHSATDTLYTWPDYRELIGATFDGHPWAQRIRIDVEDPENPIVSHLAPGFEIADEIYQFRDFSRTRVRVLMTIDAATVDLDAPGVNRADRDFALAWTHAYGDGRVFYTALGHVDETWRDERFQRMLRNALLWLTGRIEAPAEPRPPDQPRIAADAAGQAIGNAATLSPRAISPGTLFTVFGENLTPGSDAAAVTPQAPRKLGGATVMMNGDPVPILFASPSQINALAPLTLAGGDCGLPGGRCVQVEIAAGGMTSPAVNVPFDDRTPGVFAAVDNGNGTATLWATGLGAVREAGELSETVHQPRVEINGVDCPVLFSGLAPGWTGLYQVNVTLPAGTAPPFDVRFID